MLERSDGGFWLAQALLALSYASYYRGDFTSSIAAASRLEALGEQIGSRLARANGVMMSGLCQATSGAWDEGIAAEQRALELSPDDFERAWILACLGKAYTEAGDAKKAVQVPEQTVGLAD